MLKRLIFLLVSSTLLLSTGCGTDRQSTLANIFLNSNKEDPRVRLGLDEDFPLNTIGVIGSSCVGTLLSDQIAITSSHCLIEENGSLKADSLTFKISGTELSVKNVIARTSQFPSEINSPELLNDWAFVILEPNSISSSKGYMSLEPVVFQEVISDDDNSSFSVKSELPYEVGFVGLDENSESLMYDRSCYILKQDSVLYNNCSSTSGGSGGVLFSMIDGSAKVVAIMIAEKRQGYSSSLQLEKYSNKFANIALPVTESMVKLFNSLNEGLAGIDIESSSSVSSLISAANFSDDTASSLIIKSSSDINTQASSSSSNVLPRAKGDSSYSYSSSSSSDSNPSDTPKPLILGLEMDDEDEGSMAIEDNDFSLNQDEDEDTLYLDDFNENEYVESIPTPVPDSRNNPQISSFQDERDNTSNEKRRNPIVIRQLPRQQRQNSDLDLNGGSRIIPVPQQSQNPSSSEYSDPRTAPRTPPFIIPGPRPTPQIQEDPRLNPDLRGPILRSLSEAARNERGLLGRIFQDRDRRSLNGQITAEEFYGTAIYKTDLIVEKTKVLIQDLVRSRQAGPATTKLTTFMHKALALKNFINLEKQANRRQRRGQYLDKIFETIVNMNSDLAGSYYSLQQARVDLRYFDRDYSDLQDLVQSISNMFK